MTMTKYQIPQHDEMPSEDMIEWLNKCSQEWDGDSLGLNIMQANGEFMTGGPGDWVVECDGVYTIAGQKEAEKQGL